MSSDDVIGRAARELRVRSDGASAEAQRTRDRVLALTARRRQSRQRWASVAVALVCLLTISSVWAAVTGRLPRLLRALLPTSETPAPARAFVEPRAKTTLPPPAVAALPSQGKTVDAPALATRRESPLLHDSPPRRHAPESAPASPAAPDREEVLFKIAYRDQFVTRDPVAALAGWDSYLRFAPNGRFALEASYNRALCLVRMRRRADAIAALKPFAEGRRGGYREREADRLIAALSEESGP